MLKIFQILIILLFYKILKNGFYKLFSKAVFRIILKNIDQTFLKIQNMLKMFQILDQTFVQLNIEE